MSDDLDLTEYLSHGGKLSSPDNAPPRYRGELMRLMATFVDSELAGAAGFADVINAGPGIKERIAASRIVFEKLVNADRVLKIMGDFGADTGRYVNHHPWAARLPRDADIGANRHGGDMRLSVFHYPIDGWTDAVVMNVLMGRATAIQLDEFAHGSYQPLAEAFRAILPTEVRHAELGLEGLRMLVLTAEDRAAARASAAYWRPRVAASFGSAGSARYETLRRFGLRRTPNDVLAERWRGEIAELLDELGIAPETGTEEGSRA
ncbi:Phenylacetic acid catabolic protein [Thalassobaculum sp.]|uniref:Phenylacetic acid catabolic protein n=1 Tax=Thalassobaculum sp. TaxID=2022740 RepID=UPI0032EFEC93